MANYSSQTEALRARLRPSATAPAGASPFARGGQVKQLPGSGAGEMVGNLGGSIGTQIAAKQLGSQAAGTAAGAAASTGLKSALTSGASGAAAGAGVSLATGMLADKLRVKEDQPIFGGANGQYLDDYGRRFEGTGGGTHSNMVKYAGMGANPALAASTMGLSVLGGALFGLGKAAASRNAKSAYTDFRVEDGAEAIKNAYKGELGREASDDEVLGMLTGQGWDPNGGDRWVGEKGINAVLDHIRASPEAEAFRAKGGAEGAPAAAPEAGANPADPLGAGGGDPFSRGTQAMRAQLASPAGGSTPTAEPVAAVDPLTRGAQTSQGGPNLPRLQEDGTYSEPGTAGLVDTEAAGGAPNSGQAATATAPAGWGQFKVGGLDGDKVAAGHESPKYNVLKLLSNFEHSPAGLQAAFPELQRLVKEQGIAEGVEIYGSKGDKLRFTGKLNDAMKGMSEFDVIKGAGNGGEQWHWEDANGVAAPDAAAGGAAPAGAGLIDATGGASNQGDVQAIIAQLIGREGQSSSSGLAQALLNKMRATA